MMTAEAAALVERGILQQASHDVTTLRLRDRLSWPARVGLAIPAGFGAFILYRVALALMQGGIQNWSGVMVATGAGLAFVVGPLIAARWTGHGVKATVTPERLILRRHWSRGGKVLDVALDQVKMIELADQGVRFVTPWDQLTTGSALGSEERPRVVGYLQQVIGNRAGGAGIVGGDFNKGRVHPLEFRYTEPFIQPLVGAMFSFVMAALSGYQALTSKSVITLKTMGRRILLTPGESTLLYWVGTGITTLLGLWCLSLVYRHFVHPRRLVLREDRLEFHNDAAGTVEEVFYKDVTEMNVVTLDGTDNEFVLVHSGNVTKVHRQRLPRSSDFQVVRDAITAGVERNAEAIQSIS